jgi:plastocyanin
MGAMTAPGGWRTPSYPANAQGHTQQAAPVPAGTSQKQAAMSPDQDASAADKITVRIDGMRFEPSIITVEPGTTVTWIQNSSMPHTVTGQADRMQSKTMSKGQSYTYTFDKAGSFDYSCDFHPSMKGTVVVKGGGTRT